MVLGCAHPMGPLALADLIGLDAIKAIADFMYEEFKEPLYFAPPLLLRMVEAGLFGRRAGADSSTTKPEPTTRAGFRGSRGARWRCRS